MIRRALSPQVTLVCAVPATARFGVLNMIFERLSEQNSRSMHYRDSVTMEGWVSLPWPWPAAVG